LYEKISSYFKEGKKRKLKIVKKFKKLEKNLIFLQSLRYCILTMGCYFLNFQNLGLNFYNVLLFLKPLFFCSKNGIINNLDRFFYYFSGFLKFFNSI
jgi:hypothetical protein